MQNHLEISSKSQFWIRHVQNWTKSRNMEGKPSGKHAFFKCIFMKNIIFALQTMFFDGFNVLMSFLAEK